MVRLGEDLASAVAEVPADEPVLVLAHPAGGTRFACRQIEDEAGGFVSHEKVKPEFWLDGKSPRCIVTFRLWGQATRRFPHRWALVRDPLPHVFSVGGLFRGSAKRGMVLARMYGDGMPRGPLWAQMQQKDALTAALQCLLQFYRKLDQERPTRIYRVEDIAKRAELKRKDSHRPMDSSWEYLYKFQPQTSVDELAARAKEFGYDGTD